VFNVVFLHNSDEDEVLQAKCHYTEAEVDGGVIYKLYDDAHVQVSLIDWSIYVWDLIYHSHFLYLYTWFCSLFDFKEKYC